MDATVNACLRGALLTAFVLGGWCAQASAQTTDLEQKVKAAFLFNFLKFVTWPQNRTPADREPYLLCVIGDERFTHALGQAIHNKSVSGHAVEVRDLAAGASLRACHLAYLAHDSAPSAAEAVLGTASGAGVLTVHEADAAVPSGVMRFFLDQQRVRFEINTTAAHRENLQVSSRLMELAERVQLPLPK